MFFYVFLTNILALLIIVLNTQPFGAGRASTQQSSQLKHDL